MLILPLLERVSKCRTITGYYHIICDEPPAHVKYLYDCKTISQFERDLDFLLRRYRAIDIAKIIYHVKAREPLHEPIMLLSFDDGLREIYDYVVPILLRKGVPSVFFINTAFIDNKEMSYDHKKSLIIERLLSPARSQISRVLDLLGKKELSTKTWLEGIKNLTFNERSIIEKIGRELEIDFNGYLKENHPYLGKDQIIKLLSDGFYVGSHSIDHPRYIDIPLEEQLRQTVESTLLIKSLFGIRYGLFAFPYNDNGVTSVFIEELAKREIVDITFGTSGLLQDSISTHIQRMSFEKPVARMECLLYRQLARRFYRRLSGNGIIYHPAA